MYRATIFFCTLHTTRTVGVGCGIFFILTERQIAYGTNEFKFTVTDEND